MEEIVKFSVNNWTPGIDYPEDFPFCLEGDASPFAHNDWCIQNKLCVVLSFVDMSFNWCITAPKTWVEVNCPCILGSNFQYYDYAEHDRFNKPFRDYTKENFGCIGFERGEYYELDHEQIAQEEIEWEVNSDE